MSTVSLSVAAKVLGLDPRVALKRLRANRAKVIEMPGGGPRKVRYLVSEQDVMRLSKKLANGDEQLRTLVMSLHQEIVLHRARIEALEERADCCDAHPC